MHLKCGQATQYTVSFFKIHNYLGGNFFFTFHKSTKVLPCSHQYGVLPSRCVKLTMCNFSGKITQCSHQPNTGPSPQPICKLIHTYSTSLSKDRTVSLNDGTYLAHYIALYEGSSKKRPNFLNSAPTSKENAMRLLSTPSFKFC
jgi:hypothetical protein